MSCIIKYKNFSITEDSFLKYLDKIITVNKLFEENPQFSSEIYEALGFNQLITSNDRIVFGHPTIGKSYLKKQGEDKFISLDDDYATEINNKVKEIADKYNVTTYQVKDGGTQKWNNEYNQMMQEMFNVAKQRAISENKTLFTSNTNLLRNNTESFDKVINLTDVEFEKRIQERGAKYNIKEWKSQINEAISKIPTSKVINTNKYLSDLFITPEQKQQALQLYSKYLSNFVNTNFDSIIAPDTEEETNYGIKRLENQFVVFEPEQIHILGNKQDLEGFKNFVKESTTKLQGKKVIDGKLVTFDVIEELASNERENIPSAILIKKLLNGGYLPKINEADIVLGGLEYGVWKPNLKKIEARGENKSTLAKKIGHELLHSITDNIIYSYQNLKGTVDFTDKYYKDFIRQGYIKPIDLNKSQIEALDNLVRIRNKVVSYVEQNKDKIQKQDRGFGTYDYFIRTNYTESETDLHEFISEVFTNPELINILKEIPTEGKKSNLFRDFVNAIAKILGFTNTSILEDIIAYSEEAFFQQPQVTSQQEVDSLVDSLETVEKDCGGKSSKTFKAESGFTTSSFTPGSKWTLVKDLKGPSHAQGGIDLSIDNGKVMYSDGKTKFHAANGLVIKKNLRYEN